MLLMVPLKHYFWTGGGGVCLNNFLFLIVFTSITLSTLSYVFISLALSCRTVRGYLPMFTKANNLY
jgi:hypothetical protein